MVAYDAFSQALTSPLLAPRVFNEQTFSATGMQVIEDTKSISDIVNRNVRVGSGPFFVSLTRRDYRRS
jgi:prostaglandin-endoperoxide synthase 2